MGHSACLMEHLGACSNFALLSGTTLTFSASLTVVTSGSVGSYSGSIPAGSNYYFGGGTTQIGTALTNQCVDDKIIASSAASKKICTTSFTIPEISGKTLSPGVYCSTQGTLNIAASGTLMLDGLNNTSSVWVFQAKTTIFTYSHSTVVLINKAQASNVFWSIGTSATLGASSFFAGQIFTVTAIDFGAKSVMDGRALAVSSIMFDDGSLVSPTASLTKANVTIGRCRNFTLFAGTQISFALGISQVTSGWIGAYPGSGVSSITGNYNVASGVSDVGSPATIACALDSAVAYNAASTAYCQKALTSNILSGLVLSPSVYCSTDFTISRSPTSH
jgi:Ice-binding-like